VLFGIKTWIAYSKYENDKLPDLKNGILSPYKMDQNLVEDQKGRLDFLYAKDYNVWTDLELLIANIKYLGN
jgi:hypothetical protein